MNRPLVEIRIRTRISEEEIAEKVGKVLTEDDFNVMPTGPCLVRKPDGSPLLIYRPGAVPVELRESTWPILHELRKINTANRGLAAGSKRVELRSGKRSEARRIPSAIVGGFEPQGPRRYCRLTAWTGTETEKYKILWPLLSFVGDRMKADVSDRWEAQMRRVRETHPDWIIPGTPFTTVTVNNTYETGVHKDAGDLPEGFSNLVVLRRGDYRGGVLVFPEYRVGVDMQDGDLLLMDAHEWHGNTFLDPRPVYTSWGARKDRGPDGGDPYERISIVSYFRTRMVECDDRMSESEKRRALTEQRSAAMLGDE